LPSSLYQKGHGEDDGGSSRSMARFHGGDQTGCAVEDQSTVSEKERDVRMVADQGFNYQLPREKAQSEHHAPKEYPPAVGLGL
jgi:hypothetical protein